MRPPWSAPREVRVGAFTIAYQDSLLPYGVQRDSAQDDSAQDDSARPEAAGPGARGEGSPLLLVHGLGSSSLAWARVFDALAAEHRVLAPDLPGFGDSDKPRYRYTIPFYAERLIAFLERVGASRATWVGHSMGAQIAIWAAIHHPEKVERLVLVAPAGVESFTPAEQHALKSLVTPAWVRRQSPRDVAGALDLAFYRTPPEARWLRDRRLALRGAELDGYAHAFSRCVHAMLEAPVHHRLRAVAQPTLLFFGERDAMVPNRLLHPGLSPRGLAQEAAEALRAELMLHPRAGHLLAFEQPEDFSGKTLDFLKNAAAQHFDVAPQHVMR